MIVWHNIALVQVVKRRLPTGLEIERRIVQGYQHQIERLRQLTQQTQGVINTAYIERLNATFRSHLAWLIRRARTLAQQPETLSAGLFVA